MKEIVIKLSDVTYERLIESKGFSPCAFMSFAEAVKNGKELPKGHGDLKDVGSIPEEDKDIVVKSLLAPNSIAFIGAITVEDYINNLPTLVEADKEEEE